MKRKIQHALVSYKVTKANGVVSYETAFRGQVVDIPKDQVGRLDEIGATVAPDADLERPGTISGLPVTASDSEILNWVTGATSDEVDAMANERPEMADRLRAAQATVAERTAEQNAHLGGDNSTDGDSDDTGSGDDGDGDDSNGTEPADGDGGDDTDLDDLIGDGPDFDKVVSGTAKSVADFIAENPQYANEVLEAETKRAEADGNDVRTTIVRAAEAAAGFTAN